MRREVFRGGCCFDAVGSEHNSRPPGPVCDAMWADFASWSQIVVNRLKSPQALGHLDPQAEPEQVAYELDALGGSANVRFQLDRDEAWFEFARRSRRGWTRSGSTSIVATWPRCRRRPPTSSRG